MPYARKIDVSSFSPMAATEGSLASRVLMVRPVRFAFNEETAADNAFQRRGHGAVQERALHEFDGFVDLLRANGVDVVVVEDTLEPYTPDSIFPNNWFTTHASGELVLFPMCAPNRRAERKDAPLQAIKKLGGGGRMKRTVDLTEWEAKGHFLEGTGSMVLDRANRIAFVCRSPRSSEDVLDQFCLELDYTYFYFNALDGGWDQIYHTNVMMCMGDTFVVVCLASIGDAQHREEFLEIARKCGKEVVDISLDQMEQYAGNMLQLKNQAGESVLVMSETAKVALDGEQLAALQKHCKLVAPKIDAIETNGGGSARCMMAEIFF